MVNFVGQSLRCMISRGYKHMASPQKQKGSGWEREVANDLSTLYCESFIRSPGSGAYVGGLNGVRRNSLHKSQIRSFKGDIVPGPSFAKLNIECKFYMNFPFHQLLNSCKQLDVWIGQLMSAADTGDFNMLIMKFNRKGKFIAVQATALNEQYLTYSSFLKYTSKKFGGWYISDYSSFWEHNKKAVKFLC